MNAERLSFKDNSFDIVCGTGILHHLDLDKACRELARVLAPEGRAIFIEPRGHNLFINLYRRMTPSLRTEDEHTLLTTDIKLLRQYFGIVGTAYYHLFSIAAVPFQSTRIFRYVWGLLEKVDQLAFRLLPFLRKYAWMVVITVSLPDKVAVRSS